MFARQQGQLSLSQDQETNRSNTLDTVADFKRNLNIQSTEQGIKDRYCSQNLKKPFELDNG